MRNIGEQLQQSEDRLRALREDKARAVKLREAAKKAYANADVGEDSPLYEAAMEAAKAVRTIDEQIDVEQDRRAEHLRVLGDAEQGRSGLIPGGPSGWETAARRLDLGRGELRVDVPASSLLRPSSPMATVTGLPPSGTTPSQPLLVSVAGAPAPQPGTGLASGRWLYPVLANQPFDGPEDFVETDFTISYSEAQLTGGLGEGVERDPDQTSPDKATMDATVSLATPAARQFAAVLEAVPARIFDTQGALRALLGIEMSRQLSESFDDYVTDTIEAATPPHGSTGSNLVEKIRNATAAAHGRGSEPTIVCLTPTDAASLDLTVDGSGRYVFLPNMDGQQTAWRLYVREVPSISHPTLIDPQRLGLWYSGEGSVLVDPFGANMKANLVSVRAEVEATFHVRNIQQGAYQIA